MRVLFVARYRDATMRRKLDYLAQEPDVELLCVLPSSYRDELLDVHQAASHSGRYRLEALPMIGSSSDPHRALYRTLRFYLPSFRPDIIHVEEEPDSLAALQMALLRGVLARRARLLLHTWQNIDRPRSWYVEWVKRTTLRAADAVFCANQAAQRILQQHGFTRRTLVLPAVGVDTTVFRPCPPPAPGRPFTVGFVGRFVPEKGIATLLEAVRLLGAEPAAPGLRVRLIGAGPDAERLARLAEGLGNAAAVDFVAAQPPAELSKYYCQLDALVLPSRSTPVWEEQLGRVLLEAMACGVPVIGSDSGAIPEVIDTAGLIFPEGDAAALAGCISRLLREPGLRDQCAAGGRQRVNEHYSQQVLAARTAAFYRQECP